MDLCIYVLSYAPSFLLPGLPAGTIPANVHLAEEELVNHIKHGQLSLKSVQHIQFPSVNRLPTLQQGTMHHTVLYPSRFAQQKGLQDILREQQAMQLPGSTIPVHSTLPLRPLIWASSETPALP